MTTKPLTKGQIPACKFKSTPPQQAPPWQRWRRIQPCWRKRCFHEASDQRWGQGRPVPEQGKVLGNQRIPELERKWAERQGRRWGRRWGRRRALGPCRKWRSALRGGKASEMMMQAWCLCLCVTESGVRMEDI